MRNDRVTVVRQVEAVDDIGADIFTETVVYADIPCKLGQAGKNTLDNTPTNSVTFVTADLRLCLAQRSDVYVLGDASVQVYDASGNIGIC